MKCFRKLGHTFIKPADLGIKSYTTSFCNLSSMEFGKITKLSWY